MQLPANGERLIDAHHVAKRLNIPERTVRYYASKGLIPAFKIGPKLWRFRSSDIEVIQRGGVR